MLFVAMFFAFVGVSAIQATVCKTNVECGASECCYIRPEFEVVSRRRQVALAPIQFPAHHDTGVCETYHKENTTCYPLETANGHCGCTPGTSCQFVPLPTMTLATVQLQPIVQRGIYMPGPGSFQCVAQTP